MTPVVQEKLITAEELGGMHLDYACELVDGRIVRVSPAGWLHTLVIGRINMLLAQHVSKAASGIVTSGEGGYVVRRNPDRVRAPDLAFIANETLARLGKPDATFFPHAPDLAIEVLSPDDGWLAVEEKVRDYLGAKARLVWVVSPQAEKVYVYAPGNAGRVLGGADVIDGGDVLPAFQAKVASFFAA